MLRRRFGEEAQTLCVQVRLPPAKPRRTREAAATRAPSAAGERARACVEARAGAAPHAQRECRYWRELPGPRSLRHHAVRHRALGTARDAWNATPGDTHAEAEGGSLTIGFCISISYHAPAVARRLLNQRRTRSRRQVTFREQCSSEWLRRCAAPAMTFPRARHHHVQYAATSLHFTAPA